MNVIGIGKAGCAIANEFGKYPEYNVYKIDVGLKGEKCYSLKECETPEEYENKCPNLKPFFKEVEGEVLYITSSGRVSAASLAILQQLYQKKCKIKILYIKPDIELLDETKIMQERTIFGILQEYTRSAIFERMYIVHNSALEDILEEISIMSYYDQLNSLIVSTMHMINIFDHSEPVISTRSKPVDQARITTFGLVDFETSEEKLFFDLKYFRDRCYYYAMPEKMLKSDGTLFKKIKQQTKDKVKRDANKQIKTSYSVFSTQYEQEYVYCIAHSSAVQENRKKE
tara:strand:- start:429 stop:1283 length:855 start_codon:yes stop_codon:yes gene_type:complete